MSATRYRLVERSGNTVDPYGVMHSMLGFLFQALDVYAYESYRVLTEGKTLHSADLETIIKDIDSYLQRVYVAPETARIPSKAFDTMTALDVDRQGIIQQLRTFRRMGKNTPDRVESRNILNFVDRYVERLNAAIAYLNLVFDAENTRRAKLARPIEPIKHIPTIGEDELALE